MDTVRTFCRICEPSCGLVAHVDGGQLVKLTPDRGHPVTEGFACHKGLAAVDLHHDPDRLDMPQLRAADGTWSTTGWDHALADTARRLQSVIDRHGAGAVSAYVGNPTAFNALGQLHITTLLRTLGTEKNDACDARGLAPMTRHRSVCSRSGMGCTVLEPNTASLATNLLAQSCVPDENVRRTPRARSSVDTCSVARALNAVGLPM